MAAARGGEESRAGSVAPAASARGRQLARALAQAKPFARNRQPDFPVCHSDRQGQAQPVAGPQGCLGRHQAMMRCSRCDLTTSSTSSLTPSRTAMAGRTTARRTRLSGTRCCSSALTTSMKLRLGRLWCPGRSLAKPLPWLAFWARYASGGATGEGACSIRLAIADDPTLDCPATGASEFQSRPRRPTWAVEVLRYRSRSTSRYKPRRARPRRESGTPSHGDTRRRATNVATQVAHHRSTSCLRRRTAPRDSREVDRKQGGSSHLVLEGSGNRCALRSGYDRRSPNDATRYGSAVANVPSLLPLGSVTRPEVEGRRKSYGQ